jgi:serine/threonine protein kinase
VPNLYNELSKTGESLSDATPTSPHSDSPPWTKFIVPLTSSFTHPGPNGEHKCLVFEHMGCTVGDILPSRAEEACVIHRSNLRYVDHGLNTRRAKSILRQMLAALVTLHSKGLIHGDLHLGNVLLPLKASQTNSKREASVFMAQDPEDDDIAQKVRRQDGRDLDENVPRYLMIQDSLIPYTALEDDQLKPKLIDAEGQVPKTGLNRRIPISLHSPELALEDTTSPSQDIWAFGCAMFEVLTGFRLFKVDGLLSGEMQVDELMLFFSETLGSLSPALQTKWKHYSRYFDDQGRRNETMPDYKIKYDSEDEGSEKQMDDKGDAALEENTEFESSDVANLEAEMADYFANPGPVSEDDMSDISPILEDLIDRFKPSDMKSRDSDCVKTLLRRILQYEPQKCPQAAVLLKNAWFASPEDTSTRMSKRGRNPQPQKERKDKRKGSNQSRSGRKKQR